MPLTGKGQKIMHAMKAQYGADKGESVFYASANSGRITGVEGSKKKALIRGLQRKPPAPGGVRG